MKPEEAADGMAGALAALDRRAVEAQREEIRFRETVAVEIAARERARAFAFRRAGLMKRMAGAARAAESREAACAAQAAALKSELGWHGPSEARDRALAAWAAVAEAVARAAGLEAGGERGDEPGDEEATGAGPVEALAAFEAWYEAEFGAPFFALMDQEPLDVPVVEF